MKTIVFDLDGTLTDSKADLTTDMASLLKRLLEKNRVAIVSGGSWKQLEKQFVSNIKPDDTTILNNMFLLPTYGASMYQFWSRYGWVSVYQNKLSTRDVELITKALEKVLNDLSVSVDKTWGKQIENRECQVTWSALGQKAPMEEKEKWDPDLKKRAAICAVLSKELPNFDVKIGGGTSIDITLRGITKKFGIDQLMRNAHISKDDVVFIGDSIFEGGNDYAAVEMGLENVKVNNPDDTKKWIIDFLEK